MPTLQQLQSLVAVADHASFKKAGEAIGLAQPTVSRNIGLLEQEFGRAFFDRTSRTAVLNAAGRDLVTRSRRILQAKSHIDALLAGPPAEETTGLVLGVPEIVATTWLAAWAGLVGTHVRSCELSVVVAGTRELQRLLATGKVDLAVLDELPPRGDYVRVPLPPLKLARFASALREGAPAPGVDDADAPTALAGRLCATTAGLADVRLPVDIDPLWLRRSQLQRVGAPSAVETVTYHIVFREHSACRGIVDVAQLGRRVCDFRRWMSLPSWLHGTLA